MIAEEVTATADPLVRIEARTAATGEPSFKVVTPAPRTCDSRALTKSPDDGTGSTAPFYHMQVPLREGRALLVDRIIELQRETSHANWDEDGGEAIAQKTWSDGWNLYSWASSWIRELPTPFISPCGDGSVHLSWAVDGRRFVLELKGEAMYWSTKSASEAWSSGPCANWQDALRRLKEFLG